MQSAIFNISAYNEEIETVYPDQLKPVKTKPINFQQQHKRKTKFYNQKRREEELHLVRSILQGVLFCLIIATIGFLIKWSGVGELWLAVIIVAIFFFGSLLYDGRYSDDQIEKEHGL